MTRGSVPVLMYHEVSPDPHSAFRRYTVGAREFTRQMGWLAARGYRTIDMDTLHRARTAGAPLPERSVLITFDDGFQGCTDHALPVLRAHGFTAVFFLVTDCMGETSRWMLPEVGMELPLMGWDTARGLVEEGFQCGAHTATHPRLAGLDPARCRAELVEGRRRLEAELKRPVLHLAYPFGSYDAAARAMAAEAGYLTACSTQAGLSAPDDDLLALHRVTVYGQDSLLDFASRVRTGSSLGERIGRAFGGLLGRRGSPR